MVLIIPTSNIYDQFSVLTTLSVCFTLKISEQFENVLFHGACKLLTDQPSS